MAFIQAKRTVPPTQIARRLSWGTPISYEVFPRLAGITLRAFHLDASSCASAFRIGGPLLRDLFGADLAIPACFCPPIAYGHLACLGAEVIFPENGAPADIDRQVRDIIGQNGGRQALILGTMDNIRPETSDENIAAYFNAANKYR